MPKFRIIVENDARKQVFAQEYTSEGYARMSLYHCMADMLDRAIKEAFPALGDIDKPTIVGNIETAETGIND